MTSLNLSIVYLCIKNDQNLVTYPPSNCYLSQFCGLARLKWAITLVYVMSAGLQSSVGIIGLIFPTWLIHKSVLLLNTAGTRGSLGRSHWISLLFHKASGHLCLHMISLHSMKVESSNNIILDFCSL